MALGRSSVPDQTNPGPHSRGPFSKTSVPDQTPELRRDYNAERRAAIEAQIAAYEAEGKDTSHLKKILGRKNSKAHDYTDAGVAVPSADGETVPEPEDGSAPDKRKQDQEPKDDVSGSPVDPGPEAAHKKADRLPDQVVVAPPEQKPAPVVQEPRREAPAKPAEKRTAPAPAKKTVARKAAPRARTR